jgi:hypothetical protein
MPGRLPWWRWGGGVQPTRVGHQVPVGEPGRARFLWRARIRFQWRARIRCLWRAREGYMYQAALLGGGGVEEYNRPGLSTYTTDRNTTDRKRAIKSYYFRPGIRSIFWVQLTRTPHVVPPAANEPGFESRRALTPPCKFTFFFEAAVVGLSTRQVPQTPAWRARARVPA